MATTEARVKMLEERVAFLEARMAALQGAPPLPAGDPSPEPPGGAPSPWGSSSATPLHTSVGSSPAAGRGVPSLLTAWGARQWLALLGAFALLLGLGFFAALAMAAGVFTPPLRVVTMVVLSLLLLGGGVLRRRQEEGGLRGTALPGALLASGLGGLYLTIITVQVLFSWISPAAGLGLAALLALGGNALTLLWGYRSLLVANTLGVFVAGNLIMASAHGGSSPLIWTLFFALVVLTNYLPLLKHRWRALALGNNALGSLVALTALGWALASTTGDPSSLEGTRLVAFLLVAAALLASFHLKSGGGFVGPTLTLLLGGVLSPLPAALLLLGGGLLLLGSLQVILLRRERLREAAWAALLLPLLLTGFVGTWGKDLPPSPAELLLYAGYFLLLLLAGILLLRLRQEGGVRGPLFIFSLLLGLSLLGAFLLYNLHEDSYDVFSYSPLPLEAPLLSGAVTLLLAGALLVGARLLLWGPSRPAERGLLRGGGLLLLALGVLMGTSAVVQAGVLLAGEAGFRGGHLVATLGWFAVGIFLLRRRGGESTTRWPLAFLLAAAGKLFLYDLNALDGLVRALLFLLVGVGVLGGLWLISHERKEDLTDGAPRGALPEGPSAPPLGRD